MVGPWTWGHNRRRQAHRWATTGSRNPRRLNRRDIVVTGFDASALGQSRISAPNQPARHCGPARQIRDPVIAAHLTQASGGLCAIRRFSPSLKTSIAQFATAPQGVAQGGQACRIEKRWAGARPQRTEQPPRLGPRLGQGHRSGCEDAAGMTDF